MYYIAYVCSLFYCVFVHKNHMGHIIMFASYLVLCMFHVSKITSIKKGVSFECMYIECTQASNAKKICVHCASDSESGQRVACLFVCRCAIEYKMHKMCKDR